MTRHFIEIVNHIRKGKFSLTLPLLCNEWIEWIDGLDFLDDCREFPDES